MKLTNTLSRLVFLTVLLSGGATLYLAHSNDISPCQERVLDATANIYQVGVETLPRLLRQSKKE